MHRRPLSLLPPLALTLLAAACGSSGDTSSDTPTSSTGGAGGTAAAGASGKGGSTSKGGSAGASAASGKGGSSGGSSGAAGMSGGGSGGASGGGGAAGKGGASAGGVGGAAGTAGAGGKAGASGAAGQAGSSGAAGKAGSSGASGASGAAGAGGAAGCGIDGATCNDGGKPGACAGGVCCAQSLACGPSCCTTGSVCSFGACVTPGATCQDKSDCANGQYCEVLLGSGPGMGTCAMGTPPPDGKCLPLPPECASPNDPGAGKTCLSKCEYKPPVPSFTVAQRYAWGGQLTPPFATDVMMTPIVVQLDDDDCDGKVTARDIPEIVFSTFSGGAYGSAGVLHAISIVGGKVVDKWSVPGVLNATKQLAGGNLDGVSGSEIVGCGADGAVHAFKPDGTPYWTSPATVCFMPSIADLDQDGKPEVIVEGAVLDGQTGAIKAAFVPALDGPPIVSDLDGDGKLDIVTGARGYHADGAVFVDSMAVAPGSFPGGQDWKGSWSAIADFDADGKPEVVAVDNTAHTAVIWRYDATKPGKFAIVRAAVDLDGTLPMSTCPGGSWGNTHGGGPPTIGDFNKDGVPDVALAGGVGYAVLDGAKLMNPAVTGPNTFLWINPTTDCSSASTGSSLFDFNGDGSPEVVYSDQQKMRIYDGATGATLASICNTTATLIENPVVADVDGDGQADIVVVSNAYGSGNPDLQCNDGTANAQAGVRVFGSGGGPWVRTRRVWNQHAYHVTNIEEDGTVPTKELANWTQPGLDNFRQNKQPGSEFSAPDAVVSIKPECKTGDALGATVRNIGQAGLPPGATVEFYKGPIGGGTLLGIGQTKTTLYPAQAEEVVIAVTDPDVINGVAPVYAKVTPPAGVNECRTDNDVSDDVIASCKKF